MRRSRAILVWVLIAAALAAIAQIMRPQRQPGAPVSGHARVVDGDSLEIAGQRIRIASIDAPERDQSCRTADGKTYRCGEVAARALAEIIARRVVTCIPLTHDRYDREVAVCTVDGRDLAEALVRGGHALGYARSNRYAAAEREAREARRGLWAGSFESPATWRRQNPR
ncbi:MAG: thermonuclease family protein [Xanthobacteraceae bacterium]